MTPVAVDPSRVQVTVVAGPPVEIQVSVNIGGSAVGVVWRLNWTGSVIVTSPNYNEARVLANLPQQHSRSGTQHLKFYSLYTSKI